MNFSQNQHTASNLKNKFQLALVVYFLSLESALGWTQENNADFPRKKTADYPEINILSTHDNQQQHHDGNNVIHPATIPKEVTNLFSTPETITNNHYEIRECNTMKMCLEIYSVTSLMNGVNQNKLESSIKYILSEGFIDHSNINLPFEMDIVDINVSDHMIQGRRRSRRRRLQDEVEEENNDNNEQLYPLLVCFAIKGEYNYKREIDCEAILLDYLNVYERLFNSYLLKRLKQQEHRYFDNVSSINVINTMDQSPISSIAYAAEQQNYMITHNDADGNSSDTAIISFVVAAAIGLVLLAFGATLLMQYHKSKQENEDSHNHDNNIYPDEIDVFDVPKVDRRLTWGSDIQDDLAGSTITNNDDDNNMFSGKNHPWKNDFNSNKNAESNMNNENISSQKKIPSSSLFTSTNKNYDNEISVATTNPFDNEVAVATTNAFLPYRKKSIPRTSSATTTSANNTTQKIKDDSKRSSSILTSQHDSNNIINLNNKTKECFAPPGKLGVAIDTLNGIPVVHRVKSGSPLEGILLHKDRIVGIDEVDCTNMSAADVTKVMVTRMNKTRKITYVRNK